MGRRTYDLALRMGPFPYAHRDCYVFSRSLMGGDDNVEFVNQPVNEFVSMLREKDGLDIWLVGGSELIDPFMKGHLIDEFIISIHPVLLGEGIPMFRPGFPMQTLSLEGSTTFPSGLIQVRYLQGDLKVKSGRG